MAVDKIAPPSDAHTLYRNHHGWLLGWLRKKLRCPQDAADLAHDAFLRVLSGSDISVLKEPRAYLLVVANRLLINRYNRLEIEAEALQQVAVLMADLEERDPESVVAIRQLLAKVLGLLTDELPKPVRQAFLFARVDGLSYAEIALQLKVSESSVKQYLAKALAHCHARLFADWQG